VLVLTPSPRELWTQYRLYLAEYALSVAVDLAPKNDAGYRLAVYVFAYFAEVRATLLQQVEDLRALRERTH